MVVAGRAHDSGVAARAPEQERHQLFSIRSVFDQGRALSGHFFPERFRAGAQFQLAREIAQSGARQCWTRGRRRLVRAGAVRNGKLEIRTDVIRNDLQAVAAIIGYEAELRLPAEALDESPLVPAVRADEVQRQPAREHIDFALHIVAHLRLRLEEGGALAVRQRHRDGLARLEEGGSVGSGKVGRMQQQNHRRQPEKTTIHFTRYL